MAHVRGLEAAGLVSADEAATLIGVDHRKVARRINNLVPQYMVMGERGMAEHAEMEMDIPENTAPMMTGRPRSSGRSRCSCTSLATPSPDAGSS